ncbi:ERF family protein, partial [Mycobacteroides abscessus subsp. massiliense]
MTTIYQALSEVMKDVGAVRKGERNQQQGFSFRGIDAVTSAVYPALTKH